MNQDRIFLVRFYIKDGTVEVMETQRSLHLGVATDPDPTKRELTLYLPRQAFMTSGGSVVCRSDFYNTCSVNLNGNEFIIGSVEEILFASNEEELDELQIREILRRMAWKLTQRRRRETKTFMLIDEDKSG